LATIWLLYFWTCEQNLYEMKVGELGGTSP